MIPEIIKNYIYENIPYPSAIIGCRASSPEISYKCCEYDLAIFYGTAHMHFGTIDESKVVHDGLLKVGDHILEINPISFSPHRNIILLQNMIVLRGCDEFIKRYVRGFVVDDDDNNNDQVKKYLKFCGKRAIISSLFYHDAIKNSIVRKPILAAMWLKLSAYKFLEGLLQLNGLNPMPVHELDQVTDLVGQQKTTADAIMSALQCIGIERATRSSITRSLQGVIKLENSKDSKIARINKDIFLTKVQYLLDNNMLAACYYYIGKIGSYGLIRRNPIFLSMYSKLIQFSMDLCVDTQNIEKLHGIIFNAAKRALNIS